MLQLVVVWCRNRMNYNDEVLRLRRRRVVVWCRNRMNYNMLQSYYYYLLVVVWCRNRMNYNDALSWYFLSGVVVWCRNRMNYNSLQMLVKFRQIFQLVCAKVISKMLPNLSVLLQLWMKVAMFVSGIN